MIPNFLTRKITVGSPSHRFLKNRKLTKTRSWDGVSCSCREQKMEKDSGGFQETVKVAVMVNRFLVQIWKQGRVRRSIWQTNTVPPLTPLPLIMASLV